MKPFRSEHPAINLGDEATRPLKVGEAALYLGISVRHLQRLTDAGLIRCLKLGDAVRYRRRSLDEDLDQLESVRVDLSILGRRPTRKLAASTAFPLPAPLAQALKAEARRLGLDPALYLAKIVEGALRSPGR